MAPIRSAEATNIIEEEGSSIPVESGRLVRDVGHHAIETIRLVIREEGPH
jgi:hypothetical protein